MFESTMTTKTIVSIIEQFLNGLVTLIVTVLRSILNFLDG